MSSLCDDTPCPYSFEKNCSLDIGSALPMIVVGAEKPFVVHDVNEAFVTSFGYDREVVCGRSLGFLQGPKTNSRQLLGALGAQLKKSADCSPESGCHPIVLYSKSGVEKSFKLDSSVVKSVDGVSKRVVYLSDSKAITRAQAEVDCSLAKVIIDNSPRQAIQHVNEAFLNLYGLTESQVMGRSMRLVHGPRTDRASWAALMAEANAGGAPRGCLWTCSSDGHDVEVEVRMLPVASEDGIVIEAVMAEITAVSPLPTTTTTTTEPLLSVAPFCLIPSPPPVEDLPSQPAMRSASSRGKASPAAPPALSPPAAGRYVVLAALCVACVLLGGEAAAAGGNIAAPLRAPMGTGAAEWAGGPRFLAGQTASAAWEQRGPTAAAWGDAPKVHWAMALLDLDKTSIFGNDGNDLGIAMQWMGRPWEEVKELYRLLLSPALPPAIRALRERTDKLDLAIYTRRPQLVTYSSVFENRQVALTFDPDWHHDGQTYIPPTVTCADDIMSRYTGPELTAEERNDVVKSMERLLAARDAMASALGLPTPPTVVVTAAPKDVEATAQRLAGRGAEERAYLFDDNLELRGHPRVVPVAALTALPAERAGRLLAFLEEKMPPASLDPDLVDYLSGGNPDELALRTVDVPPSDTDGGELSTPPPPEVAWNVPMCRDVAPWALPAALLPAAPAPAPGLSAARCPPLLGLRGKAAAGGAGARSGWMSPVTPAEAVAGLDAGGAAGIRGKGAHALADLRAAAEKVLLLRQQAAAAPPPPPAPAAAAALRGEGV